MEPSLRPALTGPSRRLDAAFGLPGLLREQADRTPDAIACRDSERQLSYGELDRLSDILAAQLGMLLGERRGAVAVCLPRGVDLMVALVGVLKAGCWYLPVALDEAEPRAAAMVAAAEPVAAVRRDGAPAALADLPRLRVPAADAHAVPGGRSLLSPAGPDQPVYAMFTSGSTGRPKGVLVGSDALVNRIQWMVRAYGFGPDDVVLQKTPYTFDVSGWEFFAPLISGGCCVFAPEHAHQDPAALAELFDRYAVTVCHFVPSMLTEFLTSTAPGTGRSLRLIVCSGEPLPAALAVRTRERFRAKLSNLYGPTEAAIDVTHWCVPDALTADDTVLIGEPIDNCELYVMDEVGRPVDPGAPGELWIGGTPVGLGYVNEPELTAEAFVLTGGRRCYRTGDIVRQVGNQLRYLSRRDDQVKVRGVRIELGEIEHALNAHPAVRQAVAVTMDGAEGKAVLGVALIAGAPDQRPDAIHMRAFLRARLPVAYLPEEIHWVDQIPIGRSGKADRKALRALLEHIRAARSPVREDPDDPVARLWREVLPEADAWAEAGFLDLGGHSLSAARFRALVRAELGCDLPLALLLRDNASLSRVRTALVAGQSPDPVRAIDPPETVLPLTADQRGIWLACRLFPDSASAYQVVGGVRLVGEVDVVRLEAALTAVADRHDALRMRLVEPTPGVPALLTEAAMAPTLEQTYVDEEIDDQAALAFAIRVGADLIAPTGHSLYRVALLCGAKGSCLILSLHHVIADQRTLEVLLADIASAYSGQLPAAPAPRFADHLRERAEAVDTSRWRGDLDHWRSALAGAPAELGLPFRTTGLARSLRGAVHRVTLGAPGAARVDSFRRLHRLTPAMFFLGVSANVLAAWSGQREVVIGVPASRRETVAQWDTAGFFMATVPVRLTVAGHSDAAAFFRHVRHQQATALAHSVVDFSALAGEIGRSVRPDADNPVFQVWFNDLTGGAPPPRLPGVECRPVPVPTPGALHDLNLYLRYAPETGYQLELVRATDRVPAEVAEELLDQCMLGLSQVLDRPDLPVERLDLRTRRARQRVRVIEEPPGDYSLLGPLGTGEGPLGAGDDSGRVAVRAGSTTYTYGQQHARICELAQRLTSVGVAPGEVVELRAQRTPDLAVALLGCWRTGAVPALVDAGWPALRLDECTQELAPAARLELDRAGIRIVPGSAAPRRLPQASHVLFTTGTTGTPAAVALPHGCLDQAIAWYQRTFQPTADDRFGLLSGLGHDPLLRDLLVPRVAAAELIIPDQAVFTRPDRLLDFLVAARITVLHATPAMVELLVAAAAGNRAARLDQLRLLVSGGAPLTAGLVRRLREVTDAAVINGYGATETPQLATYHPVLERGESAHRLAGLSDGETLPVGTDAAGHQALVLDRGRRPVGIGHPGEIVIRGKWLPTGYLTGTLPGRFIPDPLDDPAVRAFRTGDLGRFDPASRLHVESRIDRQVDIGGFRVALEEVEAVALRHHRIRQCVAGIAETAAGPMLALEVVPTVGAQLDDAEVRSHLHSRLPRHAVPSRVRIVTQLALDHNHKAVLSHRTEVVPPDATLREAPVKPASWLRNALTELLGRQVDPLENLFDAGLTSLGLLRLHALLAERLTDPPTPLELFAFPNLRALQHRIAGESADTAEAALAGRPRRRATVDPAAVADAARRRRADRRAARQERSTDGGQHG